MSVYLETALVRNFAAAVANAEPSMFTGKLEADQVIIMLGELLDVWPKSIEADVAMMMFTVRP